MPSEATIAQVINLGNDFAALKIYAISMTALWVYDYFLTLEDEVAYAWKSKKKLIFVLFLITRYLPVLYLVCLVTSSWTSIYSAKLYACHTKFVPQTYTPPQLPRNGAS